MDVLLHAVVRARCRYAIIDVTGVDRAVSALTGEHIVRLVQAVELIGARGIVVGIRPEVAQTIAALGVDLSSIITLEAPGSPCGRRRPGKACSGVRSYAIGRPYH